jgi:Gpi18-like mannosyltransferase
MLGIAVMLPAPQGGQKAIFGWDVFDAWDTGNYRNIATSGYEYINDGKAHNVAFFPLFPLLIRGLMNVGLPFEISGVLINNIAFLCTLCFLYLWLLEQSDENSAKWSVIVVALSPLSFVGTVIYTEGLYLFLSAAALRAFDNKHYYWSGFWGAFATATRPTGLALIPALIFTAFFKRLKFQAYLGAIASSVGVLLFSLYCYHQFGDPLAFIHAQKGWRPSLGFYGEGWLKMFVQITLGPVNWKHPFKDLLFPGAIALIMSVGYLLWRNRHKISPAKVDYGLGILVFIWWILAGDPLINTACIVGSLYLLWLLRSSLTTSTLIYGYCGIGLLLASGGTISLSRLAYGIVSVSICLGVLLSRHPRWGYMVMGFFTLLLATFSIRFAQNLWIG